MEPRRLVVCGFGLAEAGAGAVHAMITRPEAREGVVLAGLAGTYDADRLPVGSACIPSGVRCEGIGVGQGGAHRSAADLGWVDSDLIELGTGTGGELLSVAAASASPAEALARTRRYPAAVAEDMEGYAVAVAARLAGVPLMVVRGISNVAGDRAKGRWQPRQAMEAVRLELAKLGAG
ncbi:MAG: phosphorylase family protein [Gaiellales bacterium]